MTKFKNILDVARTRQPVPAETQDTGERSAKDKRGGKRSDPEFEQITAYVRRTTYRQVKVALLQEGSKRDFSDLVETLLNQWLTTAK
jgi:hypothetical protein